MARTFQSFIHEVMCELHFVFAYLDDLVVFFPDLHSHRINFKILFQKLTEIGINIYQIKCGLSVIELTFLGHKLNVSGLLPLQEKLNIVNDFPLPNTIRKLRQFLGVVNYYQRYINHTADKLQTLSDLLNGKTLNSNATIKWNHEALQAFEIVLITDASNFAIGAVLQQKNEKINSFPYLFIAISLLTPKSKFSAFDRIISYFSRS